MAPNRYSLRVSGDGIIIACDNAVGLAWALASLQQLLAHWSKSKMCVALIVDKPLLGHRGVLLDVARNFVPLPDITLLLHTMAAVKLNVLHMHLTDDQVPYDCKRLLIFHLTPHRRHSRSPVPPALSSPHQTPRCAPNNIPLQTYGKL
jgi:hypothetical protein